MESMLGFSEHLQNDAVEDKSHSFKLVPWTSWDEWKFVRESIFSPSPDSVASALRRISTWRSRGCIPVAVEVTASIVDIQQKDPYFRNDLNDGVSQSDEMLAMLYCMSIMRLVNGVLEKTRKKYEISIGEAADAIGIPRMLIDIRHEASHRDLPSLQLVRLASNKALGWLVSYYWEPQGNAIPIQNDQVANRREEIKRRICELSVSLKAKQMEKSSPSHLQEKRSKKQLAKSLKHALRLYSSFSSEVVYILLEHLLNALDPSKPQHLKDSESGGDNKQTAFDAWKSVVLKLSRKEPDFLLTLTQAVLEKMETNKAVDSETDSNRQASEKTAKSQEFESLSHLLAWLIGNLKMLNPAVQRKSAQEKHLTEATVLSLLRRCLLISSPENKQLKSSILTLAHLTGNTTLFHKLKKLALLPNLESNLPDTGKEYSLHQAKEKLESIKRRVKGNYGKSNLSGVKGKWAVVESWNSCPIGMLPCRIGFSGRLPDLDVVLSLDGKEGDSEWGLGKRESENGVEEIDIRPTKKMAIEAVDDCETMEVSGEGVRGRLLIEGVWRKVGVEEVVAIASAVKLLV